jgi:large subunit ribosomal protein L29
VKAVICLLAKNLRELTDEDLADRLAEQRKELFNLRFQSATGALENSTRLKLTRREIARILTVQHERGHHDRTATKAS